jgi:hypothetical protein
MKVHGVNDIRQTTYTAKYLSLVPWRLRILKSLKDTNQTDQIPAEMIQAARRTVSML